MAKRVLPLIPSPLVVDHVELSSEAISIHCRFRSHTVRCPDCLQASQRFHSRYERRLADLPWQGRTVTIALNIRRLRCGVSGQPMASGLKFHGISASISATGQP